MAKKVKFAEMKLAQARGWLTVVKGIDDIKPEVIQDAQHEVERLEKELKDLMLAEEPIKALPIEEVGTDKVE
jgi:hypothetical protein